MGPFAIFIKYIKLRHTDIKIGEWIFEHYFSMFANSNHNINMGVKAYNALILVADTFLLLIRWFYIVIEGVFELFVPTEEQDVSNEIVLVGFI